MENLSEHLQSNLKLDELYSLVSQPVYKAMLIRLCRTGAMTEQQISVHFNEPQNTLPVNLRILQKFELISRKTIGKTKWVEANLEQVKFLASLLENVTQAWSQKVGNLSKLINEELANNHTND